jgi:hypothetical protein
LTEKTKNQSPPYATFPSFLNFINKLRDTQVPSRIDPSVFGNASGSVSYSIIAALKSLGLIRADGVPEQEFINLVRADDTARKPLMMAVLGKGYPTLYRGDIDIRTTTAGQFDEHIREAYDVKGSTVDKVATFFIAAAKYAELEISPHLAARKPTASSAASAKSKRQRKVGDSGGGSGDFAPPPTPPANSGMSDKALEYKLVDLMKESGIGEAERSAIWTLIQYLTTRAKSPASPNTRTASPEPEEAV